MSGVRIPSVTRDPEFFGNFPRLNLARHIVVRPRSYHLLVIPNIVTPEQLAAVARWTELKRWEKKELGQDLRRLGLSYGEIGAVLPVKKGTLSGWCRNLPLTTEELDRLAWGDEGRRISRARTRRSRRLEEINAIRNAASLEAESLISNHFWMAGTIAYWAEGAKGSNRLVFANSDPEMVVLFIRWAKAFLSLTNERFTIALHLHEGQNEDERKQYWSTMTGIPLRQFRKTFIKPEGTGHRKNVLYNGTASLRVLRSADLLHQTLGWIEGVKQALLNDSLDCFGAAGATEAQGTLNAEVVGSNPSRPTN